MLKPTNAFCTYIQARFSSRNFKQIVTFFLEKKLIMSFESALEQQRRYHEERERLMDTMTKEMLRKKATVSYDEILS